MDVFLVQIGRPDQTGGDGQSLAGQLGGRSMSLDVLHLKLDLANQRDLAFGIVAALMRVHSREDQRATELMKA